jgi:hypothetical protein
VFIQVLDQIAKSVSDTRLVEADVLGAGTFSSPNFQLRGLYAQQIGGIDGIQKLHSFGSGEVIHVCVLLFR